MSQPYPPQYDGQPVYRQQSQYPQCPQQQPIPSYSPQAPVPQTIRKPRRWPWIIALVVVFFIGIGIGSGIHGNSTTNDTATTDTTQTGGGTSVQPTTVPANSTGRWTTTHTFTGSGAKKTATFSVGDDWKIVYTCSGMNIGGTTSDANLIVSVDNSDGTPADPAAINTICKAGKTTSDNTEEHQNGNVYLDVNAEGDWAIQIQEMK
ncbi:MAG TPA: hypothetical protein VII61_01095 [Ktedonobacteraceae bacterium]